MRPLKGVFFEARSARSRRGFLTLLPDHLLWEEGGQRKRFEPSDYTIETPLKNCPLIVEFHEGQRIEVDHEDYEFAELKKVLTSESKLLLWLENNFKALVLLLLAGVVIVFVGVRYVIPAASYWIAEKVPHSWAIALDEQIIKQLDDGYFEPSEVSPIYEFGLAYYFEEKLPDEELNILFRKHSSPNAFALAGNTMILTDEIIELLQTRERLLAIVLHELGHLKNRDVLASIIASSSLAALSVVLVGEMPGITESLFGGGVFLASSSYSRDAERKADLFAKNALLQMGLPTSCLTESFEIMREKFGAVEELVGVLSYLSTHPTFEERLDGKSEEECPKTPLGGVAEDSSD